MQSASPAPAMRWLRLDDWFVLFTEPARALHDGDWQHMLTQLRDPTLRGFISVINYDGHPSVHTHHLHTAAEAVRGQTYNIAVLTSHRVTLALARILNWFGISVRCYESSQIVEALDWADVPRELHPRFISVIESLRQDDAQLDVEVFSVRSV